MKKPAPKRKPAPEKKTGSEEKTGTKERNGPKERNGTKEKTGNNEEKGVKQLISFATTKRLYSHTSIKPYQRLLVKSHTHTTQASVAKKQK